MHKLCIDLISSIDSSLFYNTNQTISFSKPSPVFCAKPLTNALFFIPSFFNSNKNCDEQLNSPTQTTSLSAATVTNPSNKSKSIISPIFQIVHWNCRSFNKKSKILQYLEINQPDLLILNEINCKDHIINLLSHSTSYQIEAKCRKNKRGGGVCIFIKNSIEYNIINTKRNRINRHPN